jgi:mono/diheme cytochrome c family protein
MGNGKSATLGIVAFGLVCMVPIIALTHGWMAPKEAAELSNPVALDSQSAGRGKEIYLDDCAACHGDNIEGMKGADAGLEMDTPNLKARLLTHTDGDFFWRIQEGRGDMPSFKDDLYENQIWDVINYIRHEAK